MWLWRALVPVRSSRASQDGLAQAADPPAHPHRLASRCHSSGAPIAVQYSKHQHLNAPSKARREVRAWAVAGPSSRGSSRRALQRSISPARPRFGCTTAPQGTPNKVMLVTFHHATRTVTPADVHAAFGAHGMVQSLVLFHKAIGQQALIQVASVREAQHVKAQLHRSVCG